MTLTFERSPDTAAAIEVLRGVNDMITYADGARRSGLSVKRFKEVLASARRSLDRDMVGFGVVRGVGLKRLGPADKAHLTLDVTKRAARGLGRGLKRTAMADVDFNSMAQTDQHLHTTNRTVMAMTQRALRSNVEPPKPQVVTAPQPMPDVANLVSLAKKKG